MYKEVVSVRYNTTHWTDYTIRETKYFFHAVKIINKIKNMEDANTRIEIKPIL